MQEQKLYPRISVVIPTRNEPQIFIMYYLIFPLW